MVTVVSLFCCAASFAGDWREAGSEHFIVYFTGDKKFAEDVLDKAEVYYRRIASDLGYPRYSEFWTWDNRVKIYIYPDRNSFLAATAQPAWSQGMADYARTRILSYAWSEGFIEHLLPHEMAHLVFRDFVGFKGEVPVWLDEGVAQWAETPKREKIKAIGTYLVNSGMLFSVADMVTLDIRRVGENDRVSIRSARSRDGQRRDLSLSGAEAVKTYYMQAVSLVGFLIERYGAGSFTELCRQLRDGKRLDDALRYAYPARIGGIEELEKEWREHLDR